MSSRLRPAEKRNSRGGEDILTHLPNNTESNPVKILHIFQDRKFAEFVASSFSEHKNIENRFIHIGLGHDSKKQSIDEWNFLGPDYLFSKEFKDDTRWCHAIIFHYMTSVCARSIRRVPKNVVVMWSGWGRDYYDLNISSPYEIYESKTRHLLQKNYKYYKLSAVKAALKGIYRQVLMSHGLSRVDIFSSPIPSDFQVAKNNIIFPFNPIYSQINYGDAETTFQSVDHCIDKYNIIVGNSATPENNHIEIFDILKDANISDRSIIVPLSYGDQRYREMVIKIGESYFGNKFVPLTSFLPIAEYKKIISSCCAMILNQRRQQALGNIGAMLYSGGAVYLNEKSPVVPFLKNLGVNFRVTNDIIKLGFNAWSPIENNIIEQNRISLNKFWGSETIRSNIIKLLENIGNIRAA